MLRFDNKVVVVTGASSGIGMAAAIMFARQGAKVVATYNNNPKGADNAVAKIKAAGGTAMAYGLNVAKSAEVNALAAATVKEYGGIDVWVNNAGKVAPPKELKDVTDKDWEDMLAVDLDGCFYGSRAAANQMIRQGHGGRIVNVSSIHGTLSEPSYGPYTAAKGGMESFTRTLATELARYKITCNTIAPGATFTELTVPMYTESVKKALFERISLKEIAEADWIAAPILFLASEEARYITGTVLYVDGGYVMDGSLPGAKYCTE
jgi:NAD(P)-dependent dehydrogenase (short-subunit alcohol dehydrogenase family)